MTIEKLNEIKEHLDELLNAEIQVRDYTQDPPIIIKCKISKKPLMQVKVVKEEVVNSLTESEDAMPRITNKIVKFCLLKRVDNETQANSKLEEYRFSLEKVYDAYKNNSFVTYNTDKKRIIKKTQVMK